MLGKIAMGGKVAIIQSNYIPWKGYFDIIHDVDLFIFYDDLQYTSRDWRNRNIMKTKDGPAWLTVPVGSDRRRLICEVEMKSSEWQKKHWHSLKESYGKAPFFREYVHLLEKFYLRVRWPNLSEMNQHMVKLISKECLGIKTDFQDSREYDLTRRKQFRLLELLKRVEASTYVSGPAAKTYIDEETFRSKGIRVIWKDYTGYPEYSQLYPPFRHDVSVLDLLFHTGPDAPWYIWGWREERHGVD